MRWLRSIPLHPPPPLPHSLLNRRPWANRCDCRERRRGPGYELKEKAGQAGGRKVAWKCFWDVSKTDGSNTSCGRHHMLPHHVVPIYVPQKLFNSQKKFLLNKFTSPQRLDRTTLPLLKCSGVHLVRGGLRPSRLKRRALLRGFTVFMSDPLKQTQPNLTTTLTGARIQAEPTDVFPFFLSWLGKEKQ